mgnify:CR=1 FL=1
MAERITSRANPLCAHFRKGKLLCEHLPDGSSAGYRGVGHLVIYRVGMVESGDGVRVAGVERGHPQ